MSIDISTDIQFLKGVGPKRAENLLRLGLRTVGDLLFHFPSRYEDRRNLLTIDKLEEGKIQTVKAKIAEAKEIRRRFGKKMFQLSLRDDTGILSCIWFMVRGDYFSKKYTPGLQIIVTGKVAMSRFQRCFEMAHPDITIIEEGEDDDSGTNPAGFVPVYPLTEGINQKVMNSLVTRALENSRKALSALSEPLPPDILDKHRFPSRGEAVAALHSPENDTDPADLNRFRTPAQRRMIFEEFFFLETAMAIQRSRNTDTVEGVKINVGDRDVEKIISSLPFTLTDDQMNVLGEITGDMRGPHPMNRLLQGDVGCGKTIVAAVTMMLAIKDGYQAVIMAPTEILAEQHFKNISNIKTEFPVKLELLKASTKGKKEAKERIASGEVDLIIGTHALIQEDVSFKNLGVVVIDEQHRFGVKQRAELISKGARPNTLIMTATPIPRTLALTIYSDLDVSVIKTMPKGRGTIETKVIKPNEMTKARIQIHREVKKGRQAYIIYPLVEESEKSELKAATEMYENYRKKIFPDLKIGLVHGRMKADEKESVMHSFMNRELDVLISTTVVEVGIDQPNATVMMVEHSERFGLAQLHQLRGRVGRGTERSYCLLAIEYPISDVARERLKVMTKTTDGFIIAEKDLELRGTGDILGTKQSGLPEFKMANLLRDFDILKNAKDEAFAVIGKDPTLKLPEHQPLRKEIERNWSERLLLGDIG
ncbi:MAG: ATP-dependent DNA helicase RecG [Nitrospinota bacterium]|nr:ATP-dependent DNA helicase RecG [Nitrospinota bacterium]